MPKPPSQSGKESVMEKMRKSIVTSEFAKSLSEYTRVLPMDEQEVWGIFVRGERVSLRGGKQVWKKRHYAVAALKGKVRMPFGRIIWALHSNSQCMNDRERNLLFNTYLKMLEEERILEYRRLA